MSDKQNVSDTDALSNEIVRALGNELKRLRATHRESEARIRGLEAQYGDLEAKYGGLVARNSDLKASHNAVSARNTVLEGRNAELEGENARLQQELGDTRRALVATKVKEEDSEPCILAAGSPYEQVKRALDESMRQRKEESQEHDRVMKALQDRLAKSDQGRVEMAAELVQAQRLKPPRISSQRSSSSNENPRPVPRKARTAIAKHANGDEGSTSDDEESEEESDAVSASDADESVSSVGEEDEAPAACDDAENVVQPQDVDGFDLSLFLGSEAVNSTGVRESPLKVELGSRALRDLRKIIPQPCWVCTSPEVIWSNEATKCLFMLPSQLHDANSGATTDIDYDDRVQEDEVRDLFHKSNGTWFYRGTFRCTGRSIVSYRCIKSIVKGQHNVFNTIFQRTVPGSHGSTLTVQDMYRNEQLWIVCFRLEKVGENHNIVSTLAVEACEHNGQERSRQGSRRKRPSHHTDNGGRKKRKLS
ncbi:uncharacterized protein B0H18DRAFT_1010209 [Fomitopsis serialis]|uniref:uncharacterized protein n=1 Tax=Fomitopsis serialis TaxID=139415 RepID=UPI002007EB5C|nr:uncharacterized protein B0H18DRAFT_1010209 [Neoantrodia serialis]KAH9925177.1 hypothetical protein B0H18DRAFT_1010209 [Neoantrodia serialis]